MIDYFIKKWSRPRSGSWLSHNELIHKAKEKLETIIKEKRVSVVRELDEEEEEELEEKKDVEEDDIDEAKANQQDQDGGKRQQDDDDDEDDDDNASAECDIHHGDEDGEPDNNARATSMKGIEKEEKLLATSIDEKKLQLVHNIPNLFGDHLVNWANLAFIAGNADVIDEGQGSKRAILSGVKGKAARGALLRLCNHEITASSIVRLGVHREW
jgi:hypothetical protein